MCIRDFDSSINNAVLDGAPYSLVHRHHCFGGTCCLHLQRGVLFCSETCGSVFLQNTGDIYQSTSCYFMEEHDLNPSFIFLSCAWKRLILLCYILHFFHMLCAYIFLLCTFIQGWNMQNVIGSGEPDFAIIVVKISVSLECWLKYTNIKLYEGRGHIIWMKPVLQHRSLASLDPTHVVLQRYTVILYKTNWSCSISGSQNQLAWTRLDYTSVPTALCCCECKQVEK